MRCPLKTLLPLLAVALLCSAGHAAEKRTFREARFEKGELRYINDLPVLIVQGTPEEIGRQKAALTGDAAKAIADYPRKLLRLSTLCGVGGWSKFVAAGEALLRQAPPDHLDELRAFAKGVSIDRETGIVANTIMDTYRGGLACSSLLVSPEKSATHGTLFGRNLDFPTLGLLDRYGLVTVHRPDGKHAFASVGFPGVMGCLSGMNDAGLVVAVHEVHFTGDASPRFNPKGMPYSMCFRRILEECTTVHEADKLLRSVGRSTWLNLAVGDRKQVAVLEMTPKTVVLRRGRDGICACTNHFRSKELATVPLCYRYPILMQSAAMKTIDISDVAQKLDAVHLPLTMQTMIFEPTTLRLHLSLGPWPSSRQKLKELPLRELLGK